MGIPALYFDGVSSQSQAAILHFRAPDRIMLDAGGKTREFTWKQLRHLPRVGSAPHRLYFPDQSLCEITDNDAFEAALKQHGLARRAGLLRALENKTRFALIALALTGSVAWGFVVYGLPLAAKHVANVLPSEIEHRLGADTLAQFDKWILSPSQLSAERQTKVFALFAAMQTQVPGIHHYQLALRDAKSIGANAFALPNGIIIVTDDLVNLAGDEELTAVLAHEIGHVKSHHSLRHALQSSAMALLFATVLGDVASLSSLAATIPVLLVNAKYSREFEVEADLYALEYLNAIGSSPQHFASILAKLEQSHSGKKTEGAASEAESEHDFFSTHPATTERIEFIRRFGAPMEDPGAC